MNYKRVLSIAGSDSGGGAGIQADIKTISACGCYAMTAITAVTIQNTLGVNSVTPIPYQAVYDQIDAVLSDIGADAVKIGMLNDAQVIETVKSALQKHNVKNIILDPVMVSTSGHKLIEDNAIEVLKNNLLYDARVITPNIPEAEILCGQKLDNQNLLSEAAKELSQGKVSVLLKAGHLTENILTDIFYNVETDETLKLSSRRIFSKNTHGTGCTLSSAFASFIALGFSLDESARRAVNYVHKAIETGSKYEIGHGHGPVHHFHDFWN